MVVAEGDDATTRGRMRARLAGGRRPGGRGRGCIATLPELTLMQRAAAGLARRCALLLADRRGVYGSRVLLLVGAGNNGGDALFAGALLARRGAAVRAVLLAPERTHAEGLAALRRAGGRSRRRVADRGVHSGSRGRRHRRHRRHGRAAGRRRRGGPGARRGACAAAGPIVVAVDVPSGVDVDTGAVDGPAVRADVTVTFGCLKPALVVGPAAPLAGQVDLVDIGLPWLDAPPAVRVPDLADVAALVADARTPASDKYTRGVAGARHRLAGLPRRGAAVGRRGARRPGRDGPLRRPDRRRRRPGPPVGGGQRPGRRAPAGCRPGWSAAASAPTSAPARSCGPCSARPYRWCSTPTR